MSKNKIKAGREDNYQARRLFIFLSFVMIFVTGIGAAGATYWIILDTLGQLPFSYDPVVAGLFIIIFLGYLIGIIGILKPKPPLHYAILISSAINLFVSIIIITSNPIGLFQGVISAIILYLGIRFPINFGDGEATFNLNK